MNRIAKNAVWIIACRVVQAILAVIINMITARYLGPSNFGLLTYASSLVAFVVPIVNLGFGEILVKEIVSDPRREGEILGTSILLSICASLGCIIGVVLFAYISNPNEPITITICFLYSFVLFFQALDLMQTWFQAHLLSRYTSIVGLCAYLIVSIYKIMLLVTGKSVYWFAVSNAFDCAIITVSNIVIYTKIGNNKFSFSASLGAKMFAKSKHYIVSAMMVSVFAQTDKIMIKLMINEEATGYYGAAIACASMTSFIFTAIIDSFRPSILEGKNSSEGVFQHRLSMLYAVVIYLSLLQSIIMTLFAKIIIWILYGREYSMAISALRIVVWYTTFSYIGAIRNIWILANNQYKYLWQINLVGASANILLNAVLIPKYGIDGAALASFLTQFFTNFILGYIIKPIRPNNRLMLKSLHPAVLADVVGTVITKRAEE